MDRTPALPARRRPRARGGAPLAAGLSATLAATLLAAGPAAAAPPTEGLPGTGELSALATARPATTADAERQFQERTPARYRDQQLAWAPCAAADLGGNAELAAALECTAVAVPRDWNDPDDGAAFTVALSRLPKPQGRPERTVLTNPGGPGAAGLSLAALGLQPALAGTEVVGVDVRGTGASTAASCGDVAALGAVPDPRDRSPEALEATADVLARYAQQCLADDVVPHVDTEQTVADLDLVRHVLGRDTVDWVGYSGGTWLGAQYATYFPGRVGRFVLDSAVDVTAPFQTVFSENQPPAFQRRFTQDFTPYAAQHPWLFHLGATPREVEASYERLRADLAARPLAIGGVAVVDGALLDVVVAQSMYSKDSFESLAWTLLALRTVQALRAVGDVVGAERATAEVAGHVAALLPPEALADPPTPAESAQATFSATTCNDTAWSRGQEHWDGVGQRQGERFPLVGWSQTQQVCGYWDRPALTLPRPDGRDLPPLLVVQSEHDPATSYEGALATHEALGSSVLVTVADEGDHALYASRGNGCVDALVDAFLTTGAAPDGDVTCAGTGVPAPGSALRDRLGLRAALPGA